MRYLFCRLAAHLAAAVGATAALMVSVAPGSAMADAVPAVIKASEKTATRAPAWRTLAPGSCKALTSAEATQMPESWRPYLGAVRRCDLTPPGAATAQIALISVFAEEFYRDKPSDAAWESFPRPMLVDHGFRCVGGLSELYPHDQPRTLQLRHGSWKAGVPQEIRVHVSDPAVGGDYALPVLRWNAAEKRYVAAGSKTSEEPTCPTL